MAEMTVLQMVAMMVVHLASMKAAKMAQMMVVS